LQGPGSAASCRDMKIHQFRRIQVLPITLQEAWDYFSNPNNLSKLTPPAYDFQAAQVELPIYAGQLMVHRIRVLPFVRMNWLTEITHVVPGEMFIDQQLVGPYKIWHHRHVFKACASGVEMLDDIHYALPFGPCGDIANAVFVRRQLESLFDFRRDVLGKTFGGGITN
jgi:ligand-binding SRPBCC domain-containing protein